MQKRRSFFKIGFSAIVFIILEITALKMLSHNNEMQRFFLAKQAHFVMSKLWGSSEAIKYYFSLKKTNEDLVQENFNLHQEIRKFKKTDNDNFINSQSSAMTEKLPKDKFTYIPGSIIKMSLNKQHNYFILNQGSEDGIKIRSGVITQNGVIGIIDAVSKHYSYGRSFLNSSFILSARIGKEGVVSPLIWNGKNTNEAILKEIPLQFKIAQGDTVYTSGYSAIFPPDIPLGILGDAKIVNGSSYEIKVKLFTDYSSVRFISIVNNNGAEEIHGLEEKMAEK